jgi:glycosyltransferase involved in cell wall biosynthesis
MRVGIVASALIGRAQWGGMSIYTRELTRHLVQCAEDVEITLFLHPLNVKRFAISHPRVQIVTIPLPTRQPQYWEQIVVPWHIKRIEQDLIHFTAYASTPLCPVPFVVSTLDLTYRRYPHARSGVLTTLYWRVIAEAGIRQAEHVITISKCSKLDIQELLGLENKEITVTYLAPRPMFRPIDKEVALEQVRKKHPRVYKPYLLFVGTLEPVKNLTNLVKAYGLALASETVVQDLVIVGQKGWGEHPLYALIDGLGLSHRVVFTGYVPDEDLPYLYSAADALIFPSLYEGFGLPIVEAMACGTPVMTSNRSATGEVGADAVLLVDPTSVPDMARGIKALCKDEGFRKDLSKRGQERAAFFSWDKCARQTMDVYKQVVHNLCKG